MHPTSALASFLILLFSHVTVISAHRWNNWQYDLSCESTHYFAPADEQELAEFMRREYGQSMIKVVGNAHSFSNVTTCVGVDSTHRNSYIVSLTNFNDITIHQDHTVTFGAGWDIVDLVPKLRKHGLSMINLAGERVQNYVGAFTTGTHGTGKDLGNLASQVLGLEVMDSYGTIHVVNQTFNSEHLPAFRLSLGALGLITKVTIQAKPLTFLKRTTQVIPTDTNLTRMYSEIYDMHQKHDRMTVYGPHMTWNSRISNWEMDRQMSVTWWDEVEDLGVYNCTATSYSSSCGASLEDSVCYDEASDAISTPPGGACNRFFYAEIEHFIPAEKFVTAAVDYTTFQLDKAFSMKGYNNLNSMYKVRFVKGDDMWMSPANTDNLGRDSSGVFAVLEVDWFMSYNNFNTLWAYQSFAETLTPQFGLLHNVRPHWGKMSWFGADYAKSIYPGLSDFLQVQHKMDPHCQFVNEFLIDHLGIDRCRGVLNGASAIERLGQYFLGHSDL